MVRRREEHGLSNTPEYHAWEDIRTRCYSEACKAYKHYGARGIKVCDRWLGSFMNFYEDMGKRPSDKHSLDRVDVNGDYEPSNCRWATASQQARNRRNNRFLEFKGQVRTVADWADYLGVGRSLIYLRINKLGWPTERALTEPINKNKRSKRMKLNNQTSN